MIIDDSWMVRNNMVGPRIFLLTYFSVIIIIMALLTLNCFPVCQRYLQPCQCEVRGPLHSHPRRKQLEHQLPLCQRQQFVHLLSSGILFCPLIPLIDACFNFLCRRTVAPQTRTIKQRTPVQILAKVRPLLCTSCKPSRLSFL